MPTKHEAAAAKAVSLEDISDLEQKIQEKVPNYDLCVSEFQPVGELVTYIVSEGPHTGMSAEKQVWSK